MVQITVVTAAPGLTQTRPSGTATTDPSASPTTSNPATRGQQPSRAMAKSGFGERAGPTRAGPSQKASHATVATTSSPVTDAPLDLAARLARRETEGPVLRGLYTARRLAERLLQGSVLQASELEVNFRTTPDAAETSLHACHLKLST